jgi:hypothetical protein
MLEVVKKLCRANETAKALQNAHSGHHDYNCDFIAGEEAATTPMQRPSTTGITHPDLKVGEMVAGFSLGFPLATCLLA